MNGNRTRGMGGSFILILLLLGLVMWISGMRSSETGYNWNDFMADYEADQISSAVIKPNAEVPTGSVIFTMKDGSSKELFVSDSSLEKLSLIMFAPIAASSTNATQWSKAVMYCSNVEPRK